MSSNYIDLPASSGGAAAGVDSVNGASGALTLIAGSGIGISVFGTDITISNTGTTGSNDTFAGFDNSGNLYSVPGFNIDTTSGGVNEQIIYQPDDLGGGYSLNRLGLSFDPLQNSPNDSWNVVDTAVNFDINSSGFSQGTGGNAVALYANNVLHNGTGDIGGVSILSNNIALGNGTDPISVKGMAYSYGFGNIASGVTMNGQVQGYGFQPNFQTGSTVSNGVNVFYDFSNFHTTVSGGYNSVIVNPQIDAIANNGNYVGFNTGPNITNLIGNAGMTGLGVFPNIGTLDVNGSFQGVSINPNITTNKNSATGIVVNMNGVNNFAGVQATLIVQDITYTFNQAGTDGNNITVEYTNTVLAGNEVAMVSGGNHIIVSIESGVSTATQVRAALLANGAINANFTFPITGTPSNPQITYAQTNLAGGVQAGRKLAADLTGDVRIDGALSFTGALSVGQLNAFATKDIATFTAGVNSIDSLITNPTLAASTTVSGSDLLGINTAMLLTIGANSHITSSFLGYAALGLPAVVSMGTGSTIDKVEGAVFAISLDSGATGGTIDEVNLCRALAIPNGATTVTALKAYEFDLPFGDPGTTTWGIYMAPASAHNYFAGDVIIGGVTGLPAATEKLRVTGDAVITGALSVGTGATGTFTTVDSKTVTVTNGIITSIV